MKQLQYEGWIEVEDWYDAFDILLFKVNEWTKHPLADLLECEIKNVRVNVRYFVTDKEVSLDEAQGQFLKNLMGIADVKFQSYYSEYTGYLWTDEDIIIGGHDLLEELKGYDGKYLILLIDILE